MNLLNKNIYLKIFLFIGALLLIILLSNFILTYKAKKFVQENLPGIVYEKTNGLYSVNIENVYVSIFRNKISVKNVSIGQNQNRLAELQSVDSLPPYSISTKIKEINIKGFSLKNLKEEKLAIKRMNIKDSSLNLQFENNKNISEVQFFDLDFIVRNLEIDLRKNNRDFIKFENLQLKIDSTETSFPNQLYTLNSGKIEMSYPESNLKISDIAYASTVSKWQFAYHDPNHSDWLDIQVKDINLKKIHITEYLENKTIMIDSLLISDVFLKNYKNGKIKGKKKLQTVIYEDFQKFPHPYSINYVHASNFNVEYEELDSQGAIPGFINLTQMEGIFSEGITNISKTRNQTTKMDAKGKLMNEGTFSAELTFPVDSLYDYFHIKGRLGTMSMLPLNKIIEPLSLLRISEGFIQKMDFDIEGGRRKSTINMCLQYNDLSVQILNSPGEQKRSDKTFLSFMANTVIPNSNPAEGKEIRHVTAEQERDPYRSSFNYLWKIYFAGLQETLGYTKERQNRVKWLQNIFD